MINVSFMGFFLWLVSFSFVVGRVLAFLKNLSVCLRSCLCGYAYVCTLQEVDYAHCDEIQERFDIITYGKGAAILRMLTSVIGTEQFLQVLHTCVEQQAGKGVTQRVCS